MKTKRRQRGRGASLHQGTHGIEDFQMRHYHGIQLGRRLSVGAKYQIMNAEVGRADLPGGPVDDGGVDMRAPIHGCQQRGCAFQHGVFAEQE